MEGEGRVRGKIIKLAFPIFIESALVMVDALYILYGSAI